MKLLRHLLFVSVALLTLAACNSSSDSGTGAPAPLTTGLQSLESNGVERTYYVLLPEDNTAASTTTAAAAMPSGCR